MRLSVAQLSKWLGGLSFVCQKAGGVVLLSVCRWEAGGAQSSILQSFNFERLDLRPRLAVKLFPTWEK